MTETQPEISSNKKGSRLKAIKKSTDFDIESMLTQGEEVVMYSRIHWAIYWKAWAVFLLAFLFLVFIAYELAIVIGVFGVALLMYAVLKKHMLLLVLTNKRIVARYGILQVDVVSMRFKHIESIELERMLPGFLLGYANVVIMGTGNRFIVIPYIENGIAFRRAYNEMVLDDDDIDDQAVDRAKKAQENIDAE